MKRMGLIMAAALGAAAHAKIVTETLPYQHGQVALQGYLAYDDAGKDKRPGVLVVPEWWGLNDFAKEKARQVAELGYVALAADMCGDGKVATTSDEAGKLAGQFRENVTLWRERAKAAYDALAKSPRVDSSRIAAIGFCFGGSTALQMAAAGYDLAGVVSFHGGLFPISPDDAARIKARVLVLHGAADTLVPEEAVKAFRDSLSKSSADWQMVIYGGAKHSFTNPAADKAGMPGLGYDEKAARRSWEAMRQFLEETFGARPRGAGS